MTTQAMNKTAAHFRALLVAGLLCAHPAGAAPYDDKVTLQGHFAKQFNATTLDDFARGISVFTPEDSPLPNYDAALTEEGKKLFHHAAQDKKSMATCFRNAGIGIATDFPSIDILNGHVRTLPQEINSCRLANGEPALDHDGRAILSLISYLHSNSAGNRINVVIPDDERSLAHYNAGKRFFYTRRGQQNMACAHCHIDYAGKRYGSAVIPAVLGITSRQPLYDPVSQQSRTLHQQFSHCMQRMGAKPLPAQSEEYRQLELFLGYMNNGLPLSGRNETR